METIGSKGETLAVNFLQSKGYRIIAKNYKTPIGEIDIIAEDGKTLVFVEVKTRSNNSYGYPFEAVTAQKQNKLKNLALLYLKNQKKDFPVRFDVLSINITASNSAVEHIIDAFEV